MSSWVGCRGRWPGRPTPPSPTPPPRPAGAGSRWSRSCCGWSPSTSRAAPPGGGSAATSCPTPVAAELDAFVARRLLTTDLEDGQVVVGVAHEAFLSAWPPLAEAITAASTALRARRRIEQAAADWAEHGRARSGCGNAASSPPPWPTPAWIFHWGDEWGPALHSLVILIMVGLFMGRVVVRLSRRRAGFHAPGGFMIVGMWSGWSGRCGHSLDRVPGVDHLGGPGPVGA